MSSIELEKLLIKKNLPITSYWYLVYLNQNPNIKYIIVLVPTSVIKSFWILIISNYN